MNRLSTGFAPAPAWSAAACARGTDYGTRGTQTQRLDRASCSLRRSFLKVTITRLVTYTTLVFVLSLARPVLAESVYVGLGDSITFGETDLRYIPSFGDRGYVGRFADVLGARTGTRPNVINLAIDGETAASFMSGVGRTPPVVGRTDPVLAAQNLNYNPAALVPQGTLLQSTVAAQTAAGNRIDTVSITLGFNELGALAALPTSTALAQLQPTLMAYQANYSSVLTQVRSLLPDAELYLLNYFNPFPADPGNPAAPIFAAGLLWVAWGGWRGSVLAAAPIRSSGGFHPPMGRS